MQKATHSLILLLGLGLSGFAQYPARENFAGDVQRVTYREVTKKSGNEIAYGYEYDRQGREILLWTPYFFDTGTLVVNSYYDAADQFVADLWLCGDDTVAMDHYTYDAASRLVKISQYSSRLGWYGQHLYYYNEAGLESLHHWITRDADTVTYTKAYDDLGRCILETEQAGDQVRTTRRTFDEKGNPVEEQVEDNLDEAANYQVLRSVDDNGLELTSTTFDSRARQLIITRQTYTAQGELLSQTTEDKDGKRTETYTYEYDAMGNWIVQTTKKGRKTIRTTYREFVYY